MQIRQLRALRAVMQTRSITQAAEMMSVTQPAVSVMISNLEEEVGFPLFERIKGRLIPTYEGLQLADEAEKTISSFTRLGEVAKDIRDLHTGSLRIASLPGPALDFLPKVIADFIKAKPHIDVSLQIRASDKVKEWVSAQNIDFGIAEIPIEDPAVEFETLAMRCVCVIPEGHALAAKSVITPGDLDNLPLICLNRDHMTYFRMVQAFEEAGARMNVKVEAQLFYPACVLVSQGVGISLIDPISVRSHAGRGVVTRPFLPAIPFDLALMYPANRPRSRLVADFVGLLKSRIAGYQ